MATVDTLKKIGAVWTTSSICSELFGDNTPAQMKKTERWLIEQGLNFTIFEQSELMDENGISGKQLITNYLTQISRKKRQALLYVQKCHSKCGHLVVFAYDGRSGRRWIFFNDKNTGVDEIRSALESLAVDCQKDTTLIPIGSIVADFRQIIKSWKSDSFTLAGGNTLRLAIEVYQSERFKKILDRTHLLGNSILPSDHLSNLEAESIHIIREVIAEARNPVMLYSIGKDSSVMLHLALKAFYPNKPPFPLLHVDTRWKFQAMYEFRDYIANDTGMELITHINPDGLKNDINPFTHGSTLHTDIMKTQALKQALNEHKFDVAFGGARRDEELSRAKERVFSFRTNTHGWNPKNQRPELWRLYNSRKNSDESIRVFPLSNWTELDIWLYIYRENIPIVPLYFAAKRPFIQRDSVKIMVDDDRLKLFEGENIELANIRFRTLGCYPLTGGFLSDADSLEKIILELLTVKTSERQGRAIDNDGKGSMERKKQEGYF